MKSKKSRKGHEKIERMIDYILENGATVRRLKVMICMALLCVGVTEKIIASLLGLHTKTIRKYTKHYKDNEIEKILEYETYKQKSELEKYTEQIEIELTERPCKTLKEIQARIFEITKVKRSLTQIWKFVRQLGFRTLQIGSIPSKADFEVQKKYVENELTPLIEKAKKGMIKLFFVDASHFVMGGAFGKIWSKTRMYVKSSSGRKRYNVLGALDFVTKKITTVTNETYITSTQIIELIDVLIKENPKSNIYLVLDNASYQTCNLVKKYAESKCVVLKFIPTYSPNLNLIERFWKYLKKEALAVNHFVTFKEYQEKIDSIISEADKTRKSEMDSLITEKFQLFNKDILLKTVA